MNCKSLPNKQTKSLFFVVVKVRVDCRVSNFLGVRSGIPHRERVCRFIAFANGAMIGIWFNKRRCEICTFRITEQPGLSTQQYLFIFLMVARHDTLRSGGSQYMKLKAETSSMFQRIQMRCTDKLTGKKEGLDPRDKMFNKL